MTSYGLGIDAGGTYTDTVIMNLDTGKILSSNKALTTRDNLSAGIRESLSGLDRDLLSKVSLTSLSSTLATNSVIEGKGCRAGLICIGTGCRDPPAECYAEISGKFNFSGREIVPLDLQEVRTALSGMKDKIDALAVSGYVSVRNPAHEDIVKAEAESILGVPVVCAHDLSSRLGFEQRAVTAVMNARLIPVIRELLDSVTGIMGEMEIRSPLMVVRGDGALMKSDVAAERPIETILSGPASSIMGAKALTGCSDAMIIDIGGTTSDIGILREGMPRLDEEGANIAGRRTCVKAADISTFGIGGDSRIVVNGKETILSPVRVIPLCVAASRWPGITDTLTALEHITDDRSAESYGVGELVQDTEFFVLASGTPPAGLPKVDLDLLELLKEGPLRLTDAASLLLTPVHSFDAAGMESRGYITRIGVTPTDILRAEGTYTSYEGRASELAVGYLARKSAKTVNQFIDDTKHMIIGKIAASAMEKAFTDESGSDSLTLSESEIIGRITDGIDRNYALGFTLNMPIIGIGAPVPSWLPQVAEMLHTPLILPENSHVGNAVGAVTGIVSETVTVTVRANTDRLTDSPECSVFTNEGVDIFPDPESAIEFACARSRETAVASAIKSGASDPASEVSVSREYCELSPGKKYFRSASVTARATGKPDLFGQKQ